MPALVVSLLFCFLVACFVALVVLYRHSARVRQVALEEAQTMDVENHRGDR